MSRFVQAFCAATMLGSLLAGCVNVEATRLDRSVSLAPQSADAVRIYRVPADVAGPYREVALLEANADGDLTSEKDFMESMRRKAAALGANGIILEPGLEPSPLLRTAQQLLDVKYTRYRHATAILVP